MSSALSIANGVALRFVFVVRLSSLGDIAIALRATRSLSEMGCTPIFVTSPAGVEIARCQPELNVVLEWKNGDMHLLWEREPGESWHSKPFRESRFQAFMLPSSSRKERFLLVDFQATLRSRRATQMLAKVLQQVHFRKLRAGKRSFARSWFVLKARFSGNQRPRSVPFLNVDAHFGVHAQQNALVERVAKREGLASVPFHRKPWLSAGPAENVRNFRPQVLLFLGGSSPLKIWSASHFATLLKMLLEQSPVDVVLAGGVAEIPLASALVAATSGAAGVPGAGGHALRVRNHVGAQSLSQLMQSISFSKYVVTGDSLAAHLADGLGVPCAVLFGPTSPLFGFVPLGRDHNIFYANLNCSPCSRHGGTVCRFGNQLCLESVTPEMVFAAVLGKLG